MLNRFLLENVVDIDFEARKLYLEDVDGCLLLVDLSAAFPSLSQSYLFEVMARQGVPAGFQTAVKRLYENNVQHIKLDGETSRSFTFHSGVRQGCPLSPYLFIIVMSVVFDEIHKELGATLLERRIAKNHIRLNSVRRRHEHSYLGPCGVGWRRT